MTLQTGWQHLRARSWFRGEGFGAVRQKWTWKRVICSLSRIFLIPETICIPKTICIISKYFNKCFTVKKTLPPPPRRQATRPHPLTCTPHLPAALSPSAAHPDPSSPSSTSPSTTPLLPAAPSPRRPLQRRPRPMSTSSTTPPFAAQTQTPCFTHWQWCRSSEVIRLPGNSSS